MVTRGSARIVVAATVLSSALLALPVHPQQTVPAPPPGFRPQSPGAEVFVASLDTAVIAVLPTVVRRVDHMAYATFSQQAIVQSLREQGLGEAFQGSRMPTAFPWGFRRSATGTAP